jgi:hypothetical protein
MRVAVRPFWASVSYTCQSLFKRKKFSCPSAFAHEASTEEHISRTYYLRIKLWHLRTLRYQRKLFSLRSSFKQLGSLENRALQPHINKKKTHSWKILLPQSLSSSRTLQDSNHHRDETSQGKNCTWSAIPKSETMACSKISQEIALRWRIFLKINAFNI